jgi:hypothetical protein
MLILTEPVNKLQPPSDNSGDFFERHPWLPTALLVLLPLALHVPLWLLGRSTDPIWFVSGLTHRPSGMSTPFLDPNVGFTSEALGRLVAWDWLHGIVPWWNHYTGIGMPLAGELQPGAFFFPFNLLLRLPEGILWQQISMQIIAGLATYALLRELGLSLLVAWMGGALFSLNGTFAWCPGPAAVYCTLAFLPLLLLGIERARSQQRGAVSIFIIGVATAWMILAGFPEPAYISSLPVLAWGLYRMLSGPKPAAMAWRAFAGLLLGMLVTAPLLVAFVDYVRQSDSFTLHKVGESFLPGAAFSATLLPYVYGSIGTTLQSKPLAHIWGDIGGYTGILVILLAVVGLRSRPAHRGLKWLLAVWVLLAWGKTFGLRPVMLLMNHLPLMRQTNFFRFAHPSWELALIILAAFGLDDFRNRRPSRRCPFGAALACLILAIALAWPQRAFWGRPQAMVPFAFLLLLFSVGWALAGLFAAHLSWKLSLGERSRMALACLVVFDAAVMFVIPQFTSVRGDQVDTRAVQFLSEHLGLSRIYTLGPIQPNYGAYFGVASINHNVEPVPKLWADYVEGNLLPGFSKIDLTETFWAGVMPAGGGERALSEHLSSYLDLGVRYIVTASGKSPLPMVLVPAADTGNQPGAGALSTTPRLKRLLAVLLHYRSIARDPATSAIKGFIAKSIVNVGHFLVGGPGLLDGANSGETTEIAESDSILVQSGESVTVTLPAPLAVPAGSPITSVGIMVGDAAASADGDLVVEICEGTDCHSGQRPLAQSEGEGIFLVPLSQPLRASGGTPVRVAFSHRDGSRPVALRWGRAGTDVSQKIEGPNGKLTGHTLQLAFEYGLALPGLRKVYADAIMDIWELRNSSPYFQVMQGGPCTLSAMQADEVTVICEASATLVRRELYMPGWRVAVNSAVTAVRQSGIFQAAVLPVGRSQVQYYFTPPFVGFGWAACALGLAGLFLQFLLMFRS